MEYFFKSLVFVFSCVHLARSADNFDCPIALQKERISKKVAVKDELLHTFFVVSYSILIDSGSQPHDFIPPTIVSGKPVENLYSFGFQRGFIAFIFNQNATKLRTYSLKPFEGFKTQIDRGTCVDSKESPKVMKTTDKKSRSKLKHSIVLLYGCEVYLAQKQPKVEKMAILIDPDLIKDYLENIGNQKIKMTNVNYKFFDKRGFCICNDLIDYLNCDDQGTKEFPIFLAICTLTVGLMAMSVLAWFCVEYLKTDEEVEDTGRNENQPNENPVSVQDPMPVSTVTETNIDNNEGQERPAHPSEVEN
jgi:hypothetical protein